MKQQWKEHRDGTHLLTKNFLPSSNLERPSWMDSLKGPGMLLYNLTNFVSLIADFPPHLLGCDFEMSH